MLVELNFVHFEDVLTHEPFHREYRYLLSRLPVDLLALHAVVEPRLGCEVDGLADVEACGEAGMVGAGQGQNELTWVLEGLIDLNLQLN